MLLEDLCTTMAKGSLCAMGGLTPMPRNDSVASSSTVVEMPSVPQTMMVGTRCGRTWCHRMRTGPAPMARSAAMKSRSASAVVSA